MLRKRPKPAGITREDVIAAGNRLDEKLKFIDRITILPEDVKQWLKNRATEHFLELLGRYVDS